MLTETKEREKLQQRVKSRTIVQRNQCVDSEFLPVWILSQDTLEVFFLKKGRL